MKIATHLVMLGIVAVCGLRASASTLFEDGFESDTATTNLADTSTTYFPAGWTTTVGDNREVMVYNVNATGDANKPATVPQGVNALRLISMGSNPSPTVAASWDSGYQKVSISFDIYIQNVASTARSLDIRVGDGLGSYGPYLYIGQNASSGPDIKYYNGGWQTIATNIASEAWKTFEINADSETNTFTLTYDGILYDNGGSGYAFMSGIGDIRQLVFSPNTISYIKYYVDEVSVQSIPEPATIGLLGVGSCLAFFRRKRN